MQHLQFQPKRLILKRLVAGIVKPLVDSNQNDGLTNLDIERVKTNNIYTKILHFFKIYVFQNLIGIYCST
jgi:hypothetical protein